jgi:hypothetical protein
MADENKPNDQIVTPLASNEPDNKDSNSVAHFQKIADQRLNENETLKKELETLKANSKSADATELEILRAEVKEIKTSKERERIESEYSDIEPDLLMGKTPEQQKEIVEKQRARTKEHFKNSIDVNEPQYSQSDIDTQIDQVKSTNRNPIQQATEVLRLERLKRGI